MKTVLTRLFGLLLAAVTLALATTIVAEVVSDVAIPTVQGERLKCTDHDWGELSTRVELISRRVEVSATNVALSAKITLDVPRDLPLVAALRDAAVRPGLRDDRALAEISYRCLPEVQVEGIRLPIQSIALESRSSLPEVTIFLRTEKRASDDLGIEIPQWVTVNVRSGYQLDSKRSTVKISAPRVMPATDPWPDNLAADSATWSDKLNVADTQVGAKVWLEPSGNAAKAKTETQNARAYVDGLPWEITAFLGSISSAAPFLLMFFGLSSVNTLQKAPFTAVLAVAGCLAAVFLVRAITYLGLPILEALGGVLSKSSGDKHINYWDGMEAVLLMAITFAIPVLMVRAGRQLRANGLVAELFSVRMTKLSIAFALIAATAAIACFVYGASTATNPDEPHAHASLARFLMSTAVGWDEASASIVARPLPWIALAIALILGCAWLLRELAATRTPIILPFFAAAVLICINLALRMVWDDTAARTWAVFALAVPSALATAWLIAQGMRRSVETKTARHPLRVLLWITLVVLLVAWLSQPRMSNEAISSRVSGVVLTLASIASAGVLMMMILALRRWSSSESAARDTTFARILAGAILGAFVLWPSRGWRELAPVLLLAWMSFRYMAFTPSPAVEAKTPVPAGDAFRAAIREVVLQASAYSGLRAHRKAQATKLAEGKLGLDKFAQSLTKLEDDIEKRVTENRSIVEAGFRALAFGPDLAPWERGLLGVKWGAIAGAPWTLLFIVSSMMQQVGDSNAGILDFAFAATLAASQWAIIGFSFMYFYPLFRGRTGLHKGLMFFASLAIPIVAGTLISSAFTSIEWSRTILWTLQYFVVCMVLGVVAGDYQVLQRAGLGWRHLLDAHRLGSLTAWLSSVIIAIGAAISAALSTEAVRWLAAGTQLFAPESPLAGQ